MFFHTLISLPLTFFTLATLLVVSSASVLPRQSQCISYGINYQDGGSYTVDTSSTANFTVVSQFCGCQTDYAIVELVDPSGNAIYCSMVPTTPDDTDETSSCPITNNEITSGQWLILVYGNNGDGVSEILSHEPEMLLTGLCGRLRLKASELYRSLLRLTRQ